MDYKRVLLKLSGEALAGDNGYGIDEQVLNKFTDEVAEIRKEGFEVAIVIGGGNIFRGIAGVGEGIDRVTGDQMGMLATTINSLALKSSLSGKNVSTKLFTAVDMPAVGTRFHANTIKSKLKNNVAILAGGTGNPYFSTDTAAALRALELDADIFLKGTRVDGVYNDDPEKNPDAEKYAKITFNEAWEKKLKIMDLTAFTMCQENNLPVLVFNMNEKNALYNVLSNPANGTLLTNEK